jgi:hypothetical protein
VLKATESDIDDANDVCDDPEIVKLMVEYFYNSDYLRDADERLKSAALTSDNHADSVHEDSEKQTYVTPGALLKRKAMISGAQPNHIIEHAKLFAMAVKYQIKGLRQLAEAKFMDETMNHGAWKHKNFAQAIYVVYNSTPDDITTLRDLVEELLDEQFQDLKYNHDVETAISCTPGLAYALFKRSHLSPRMRGDTDETRYRKCQNCCEVFPSNLEGLACGCCIGWLYCSRECQEKGRSWCFQ